LRPTRHESLLVPDRTTSAASRHGSGRAGQRANGVSRSRRIAKGSPASAICRSARAPTDQSGEGPRTHATFDEILYPTGIGGYGAGTIVRGTDGFVYECRPFPYSGWCNQAPAYYAPGTSSAWSDAWIRR